MHAHFGQPSRTPSTELAHYANTLIKIADRNVRASESSKYRVSRSAVEPYKSYAQAVISSDDNDQKFTSDVLPKT